MSRFLPIPMPRPGLAWLIAATAALPFAGVVVGMVYVHLPFMILPLYTNLEKHDPALLDAAQATLSAIEGEEGGANSLLARAQSALDEQAHLEPEFQAVAEVLASSLAQAEDAVHSLHTWLRRTDLDPERLAALDDRMSLWMGLARRYKRPPADLASLWEGWKQALIRLDQAADVDGLRQQVDVVLLCLPIGRQVSRLYEVPSTMKQEPIGEREDITFDR